MARTRATKSAPSWALQDAKNRFSEVVDAAVRGQPQVVTRRGVPTAVLIAFDEYQQFNAIRSGQRPPLAQYLLGGSPSTGEPFDRIRLRPREDV